MRPQLDDSAIPDIHEDVDTRPIALRLPILVIDDIPANLLAMEIALAPLEREVVGVTSGVAALQQLLDRDFALVLLDVQMPGMDGFETAAMIRSRERSRHLPIIFVTAYRDEHDAVRRAYQLGAVDFLFKPIEPEILVAKATVFVTLRDQAEQLATARLQRDFDEARRRYETRALRREMESEQIAREELGRLNDALAEADRRKDSFLAILAHELRNPLAPIRAAIDLLKEHPERLTGSRTLEILDRQTDQLSRLVEDLLDIARITANKVELRRDVHDLRGIIEIAVATSGPWIAQRRQRLSLELPDVPMYVFADRVRISQVVTNLVNNAARYTDPEGRIELVGAIDGDSARVRVIDTGIGISPAIIDRIFDMFVQERASGDGGGLGLGLALAKQLVEMHDGTIRAESKGRGMGSCFEIRFPLASPPTFDVSSSPCYNGA